MPHNRVAIRRASACCLALPIICAHVVTFGGYNDPPDYPVSKDPVVARLHEHLTEGRRPLILAVSSKNFPATVWRRVKQLVAFRLHRQGDNGVTVADAAVYLVRDSDMYAKAARALRSGSTHEEYLWCLLAAVVAHESAHTTPNTEGQALTAEAEQVRRCLEAGHLYAANGWNPLTYLGKVEAKMRNPREHY